MAEYQEHIEDPQEALHREYPPSRGHMIGHMVFDALKADTNAIWKKALNDPSWGRKNEPEEG